MEDWIKEQEEIQKSSTSGLKFLKMPEGTTEVEILSEPAKQKTNFGEKYFISVKVSGEEQVWVLSLKHPVIRELFNYAKTHKNRIAGAKMQVTRVGKGTDTRYSVKFL